MAGKPKPRSQANNRANGNPTYPNRITAILVVLITYNRIY